MKIVLTTTVVALLAIDFLKITNSSSSNDNIIENSLAQLDSESSTMKEFNIKMMRNDTSEMMNTKLAYAAQHGSEIGKEYKKIEKGGTVYMFLGQFICKNSFKKFKYLLSNLWNKNNRYY